MPEIPQDMLAKAKAEHEASINRSVDGLNLTLPEKYQDLLNANPYRNYQYEDTFFDQLGDLFGFNTTQDKLRLQHEQDAKRYDAEIASMKFQNDYNSPAANAQRMREAGLNPDLQGVESFGSASNGADGMAPSPQIDGDFQTFGNTMMRCLSMAFDLTGKVQGITGIGLDNEKKDIDNFNSALGIGSLLADTFNTFGYDPAALAVAQGPLLGFSGKDQEGRTSLSPLISFRNSGSAQRIADATNRMYHSIGNLKSIYGGLEGAASARDKFLRGTSSKYSNADFGDGDKVLRAISEPLVQYMDRALSAGHHANALSNENEATYQANRDPALEAQTEQAVNKETKAAAETKNDLNSTYRSIIHNLEEIGKGKGFDATLANSALLIISGLGSLSGSIGKGPKGKSFSLGF